MAFEMMVQPDFRLVYGLLCDSAYATVMVYDSPYGLGYEKAYETVYETLCGSGYDSVCEKAKAYD